MKSKVKAQVTRERVISLRKLQEEIITPVNVHMSTFKTVTKISNKQTRTIQTKKNCRWQEIIKIRAEIHGAETTRINSIEQGVGSLEKRKTD